MKTKFITGGRRSGNTTQLIREAVESPWSSVIVAADLMRANSIKDLLDKMYGNSKIVPVVTIRDILIHSREVDGLFTKIPKLYFDDLKVCLYNIMRQPYNCCDIVSAVIDNDDEEVKAFSYTDTIKECVRRNNLLNPHIDHVIFNGPATIVFWKDGTKTVVKHDGKGRKDKRMAIMYAFMRKIYGEGKAYHNILSEIEEALK